MLVICDVLETTVLNKMFTDTFVKQEIAFFDYVFVESIFCFSSYSVINFSPIHCVSKYLLLVLQ